MSTDAVNLDRSLPIAQPDVDGDWLDEAQTRKRLAATWATPAGVWGWLSTVDHKRVAHRSPFPEECVLRRPRLPADLQCGEMLVNEDTHGFRFSRRDSWGIL